MLTIGQLADYAGVSTRTIRHYHSIGLLPEPERSPSGYRLYSGQALVDLRRIIVLRDAGVPLARVAELQHANRDELAAAVAELDADLRTRIAELRATRKALANLADDPFLPPAVVEHLQRLRDLGVSERTLGWERDGWILCHVLYPELVPQWLAWQRGALEDARYCSLYLETDQAYEWAVDDHRLEDLAQRIVELIVDRADPDFNEEWGGDQVAFGLVTSYQIDRSPAWTWLIARVQHLTDDRA